MSEEYTLVNGPGKSQLKEALFEQQDVVFVTNDRTSFIVRPTSVSPLDDDGHDAWNIFGYIRDADGTYRTRRECRIIFSSKDRKGDLSDLGPKRQRKTIENLDQMSDEQLRREIASSQKLTMHYKREFENYLAGLDPHSSLVAEAWVTSKIFTVCIHSRLDHELFISLRGPALREPSRREVSRA